MPDTSKANPRIAILAAAAAKAASVIPPPEPRGHSSAFAVAGGCLPAWWLELLRLSEAWSAAARSAKSDEAWYKSRGSTLGEAAHARYATYRSCAEELRRLLASPNFRQPEDNRQPFAAPEDKA